MPNTYQVRNRKVQLRDASQNEGGERLPRRQLSPHARRRETQARRGERVGLETLPGHDTVGRVAAPNGRSVGISESTQGP